MHRNLNRRTATKVKNGRVQRKNNHVPTGALGYVLHRESPGRGFRHIVTKQDVLAFIDIIPDWERFSQRLERIVLEGRAGDFDGQYLFHPREETGTIFICPWPKDLWRDIEAWYFDSHEAIFEKLGVSCDRLKKTVVCRFTEAQARAFMLMHVFLHELGHHYDRSNQKHHDSTRGEDYAERFATSRFNQLYPDYVRVFGDPAGPPESRECASFTADDRDRLI